MYENDVALHRLLVISHFFVFSTIQSISIRSSLLGWSNRRSVSERGREFDGLCI